MNTVAQLALNQANGILKIATMAVPLKYVSNFWRSLEISLIKCKVELKFRWRRDCVLSVLGNENGYANVDSDNVFLLSKAQNYMFLSSLYQQKTIKN